MNSIDKNYMYNYMDNYKRFNFYINIDNMNDYNIIYDLYKNNKTEEENMSICVLYYYGVYYQINKNHDLMKKYYLMVIDDYLSNNKYTPDIINDYDERYALYTSYNLHRYYNPKQLLNYTCSEDDSNKQYMLEDAVMFFQKIAKISPHVENSFSAYNSIKKLLKSGCDIKNYCSLNQYIDSTKIQHQILKYNNVLVEHFRIYCNYDQIIILIKIMVSNNIPKSVIIKMIYCLY